MKYSLIVLFLFAINTFKAGITNAEYYTALASQDTVKINAQLSLLAGLQTNTTNAYTGALQMKKAGILKSGKEKLTLFKKGKLLLEAAIKKEPQNAEYHFLRLIIQENCPAILNYHDQINEDAKQVRSAYKSFNTEIKKAIIDYAKTSKVLKAEEL